MLFTALLSLHHSVSLCLTRWIQIRTKSCYWYWYSSDGFTKHVCCCYGNASIAIGHQRTKRQSRDGFNDIGSSGWFIGTHHAFSVVVPRLPPVRTYMYTIWAPANVFLVLPNIRGRDQFVTSCHLPQSYGSNSMNTEQENQLLLRDSRSYDVVWNSPAACILTMAIPGDVNLFGFRLFAVWF